MPFSVQEGVWDSADRRLTPRRRRPGASGAGKSTLLDILGGIDKKGLVSGYVGVFGDHHVKRRDIVSYVVQDDYNLATMTVWETLAFR